MRSSKFFVSLFLLSLLANPAWARDLYTQERVNLTLAVDSMSVAADKVREISEQNDAQLQNLNISTDGGNGNVTLRVAPANVSSVVLKLTGLGRLQSQSQSSSSYASSVEQYRARIKAFRALQNVSVDKQFAQLPEGSRELVAGEYASWVSGQITSSESSLRSYEEQGRYAEISITFSRISDSGAQIPATSEQQVSTEESVHQSSGERSTSPQFLFLCLLNMLGLWVIYRKIDSIASLPGLRD